MWIFCKVWVADLSTHILSLITRCSYAGCLLPNRDRADRMADLVPRSGTLAISPLRYYLRLRRLIHSFKYTNHPVHISSCNSDYKLLQTTMLVPVELLGFECLTRHLVSLCPLPNDTVVRNNHTRHLLTITWRKWPCATPTTQSFGYILSLGLVGVQQASVWTCCLEPCLGYFVGNRFHMWGSHQ